MAYTFDPLFAADPNNPATVAANAAITLFDPADATKAAVTITDVTGAPLANPITVNKNGFGPAFQHATLDRLGWTGGGFTGYFTSFEGIKAAAVAAQSAAETAGNDAASAQTAAANSEAAAAASATAAENAEAQIEPMATAAVDAKIAAEGVQTGSTYADERRTIRADKSLPKGFSPTISAATGTVADMRADGGQILLTGGFAIAYTNDDFATFTNGTTFTYATTAARYLSNGEILVATNYDGATSTKGAIWRSTGWATNPATATFTKVLEAVSATSWFTNAWSIDTHENIVIAAEYGPQGADPASRVWVSQDYGATWTLRFSLGASADLRAHMHGVAYDKYWGRIWICNGDDVANTAIRYSDDMGVTWSVYHSGSHQPVTIMPMPDCILFSSDMPPNGIYRAMRLPGRKLGAIEVPYKTDTAGTLTVLGQRIYKRDDGSPALFAFRAVATASDVGRIVATQDGITFHEVWKDAPGFSVAGGGVISVVGPTAKKKLIATVGGTSRGTSKLISPDVDWAGTRRHAKSHEPGGSDPLDLTGLGAADVSVGANVWISAAQFNATVGASTKPAGTLTDTSGGASFWTLSPSTDATLDASVVIPTSWGKVNIDLYWTEANGAGTGDVMWRSWIGGVADGASIASAAIGGTATATAPVYPTIKVTRLGAGVAAAAALQRVNIRRLASQPTDTLTTNAYVFGVMLSKG